MSRKYRSPRCPHRDRRASRTRARFHCDCDASGSFWQDGRGDDWLWPMSDVEVSSLVAQNSHLPVNHSPESKDDLFANDAHDFIMPCSISLFSLALRLGLFAPLILLLPAPLFTVRFPVFVTFLIAAPSPSGTRRVQLGGIVHRCSIGHKGATGCQLLVLLGRRVWEHRRFRLEQRRLRLFIFLFPTSAGLRFPLALWSFRRSDLVHFDILFIGLIAFQSGANGSGCTDSPTDHRVGLLQG